MKFIILGDLHYTEYPSEEERDGRNRFFEALFRQAAAQSAETIFALGDIVHYGYQREIEGLYNLAARHNLKLVSITGNHDTAALPKAELRPYFCDGQATAAELYHAFSRDGVRFVLLDTGREMLCDVDWSGYVSPTQLEWLQSEVAAFNRGATGDQYLVVMGHHPISDTTAISDKWRMNIENSGEVQAVLGQVEPGRAFYLCGHNHVNSIVGPDASGWTYIQTGAPLVSFCFRLITTAADGFKVETVEFGRNDPQIQAVLPRLYAALEHFADLTVEEAAGPLADREWQLEKAATLA